MSRVSVLEANERNNERRMDNMVETFKSVSSNVQDIRDAVLAANLAELPKRVDKLEKDRWIERGLSAGIGGGAGVTVMKILTAIGVVFR